MDDIRGIMNPMRRWLTSDQHFGHKNIIEYSGRPFANVDEMNEEIVCRFNEIVCPEDEVWHLGDFALDERLVEPFLSRLNGNHILIPGNHDRCHPCHSRHARAMRLYSEYGFKTIYENGYDVLYGGMRVHMTHMPTVNHTDPRYPEYRPDANRFDVLLHGHVHEKWKVKKLKTLNKVLLNVGVDQHNFTPIRFEEAMKIVAKAFLDG